MCCNNCGSRRRPLVLGRCPRCRRGIMESVKAGAEKRRVVRVARKYGVA